MFFVVNVHHFGFVSSFVRHFQELNPGFVPGSYKRVFSS